MKLRTRGLVVAIAGIVIVAVAALLILRSRQSQQADPNFHPAVASAVFTSQHPDLCFDEGHRNVHTSRGSYRPLADLAASDGFHIRPLTGSFSADALRGCRVLLIANARGPGDVGDSSAFTPAEIGAIYQWVNDGGSLLLITDHFPFGPAARELSAKFGVDMSGGMTFDPKNSAPGDDTQLVFSRANGLLGAHTLLNGRSPAEQVESVMTFTGQSLSVPPGATPLLVLSPSAVDRPADARVTRNGGDVKVNVTFGDPKSAGGRAQAVALTSGKGRVVVTGEAAMLTAQLDGKTKRPFGMNVPGTGNQQFATNLLRWLAGAL